jgi:hypothetical protein
MGSGAIALVFLTSALDGGELSASPPGLFSSRDGAPITHRTGGRVGLRAGLDAVEKIKQHLHLPGIETRLLVRLARKDYARLHVK